MDKNFVEQWNTRSGEIITIFQDHHPKTYAEIVRSVLGVLTVVDRHGNAETFDVERLTKIDDGDYQGTLLFLCPIAVYQPGEDDYWYVPVSYGSCSGCDTLQAICAYEDNLPTEEQVRDYMTLALHIVQKIKKLIPYAH